MPINMRGWKVVFENHAYQCLSVEPVFDNGGYDEHGIERPVRLRISVIDHDARFMVINHYETRFRFLKEDSE